MGKCEELQLNEPALAYIRECLECGKQLGKQLLTLLNKEHAQLTALLPQNVGTRRKLELMSEFRFGGIGSASDTLSCLMKMTQEFLATNDNHICIIEDIIVQREDRWISSSNLPILFLSSDVYYFLSSKHHNDLEMIGKVISTLDAHRVTGILTSLPKGRNPLDEREEITLEDINDFADKTQMIMIGAYDGEGVLIWRRI